MLFRQTKYSPNNETRQLVAPGGNYKGGQNAILRQLLDSDVGKAIVAVNGAGVHRVIRPGLSGSAP